MARAEQAYDDEGKPVNPDDPEAHKVTLIEHFEELRGRIMRSLLFLSAGWAGGWFLALPVYAHLKTILFDPSVIPAALDIKLVFGNFADAFFLRLKLSFIIGLILSGPLIIYELTGFIRPALKHVERKAVRAVAPISAILFIIGIGFGYMILKPAFRWFVGFVEDFEGASLFQQPGAFAIFIVKMLFAFGLGFQLPIAVWFLAKIELLSSETLLRNWRFAVVGIIALSAFLTPSGDFFSLAMMSTPLTVLYFAGIAAARVTERRREKRRDAGEFD
ncbi:MAG: twin-arginine translocase subunit TatC [Armatimonadetes bacterium]|nr:twin-arginine translocase subunit TatC [Armatimonadota bacterium]